MALKSVVTDTFIEKMIRFLDGWQEQVGPFTLAMLDSSQSSSNPAWNLSIASPWLDELDLFDATGVVDLKAKEFLGPISARYGATHVRRTNEYLVRTLVPVFDIPQLGSAYRVQGLELSFFDLDEVVVLVANPALLSANISQKLSA